jgi:hypothetical protein
LFLALESSEKRFFVPRGFCHAFKDLEGNPTNIYEQMDVDEFFNLLMDRLDLQLKGAGLLERFFGGVSASEIIGRVMGKGRIS